MWQRISRIGIAARRDPLWGEFWAQDREIVKPLAVAWYLV
jgi:hypothetical protein